MKVLKVPARCKNDAQIRPPWLSRGMLRPPTQLRYSVEWEHGTLMLREDSNSSKRTNCEGLTRSETCTELAPDIVAETAKCT